MAFLGEGWVSVHLDARRPGVKIPPELTDTRHLVLQYGRDMPIPIPDLTVGDDGISATLSFARMPHRTFIPWSAIYIVSCTDGRGILYHEDVPEDVSVAVRGADGDGRPLSGRQAGQAGKQSGTAEGLGEAAAPMELSEADTAPVRTPFLRSVPTPTDRDDEEAPPERAAPVRRRRRPQLKVVK
jgi:stringent starvation protein B